MTEESKRKSAIFSIKFSFIVITVIFFLTVLGFGFVVKESQDLASKSEILSEENNLRIHDIQESRVYSCEQTYSGIKLVFEPFFPPIPRTPQQKKNIDKFDEIILDLKRRCETQTEPNNKESK